MRKMLPGFLLIVVILGSACNSHSPTGSIARPSDGLQALVDGFNIENAKMADVLATFGEPEVYRWGGETFSKDQLPQDVIMMYPYDFGRFAVWMQNDRVQELRFEGMEGGYCFRNTISLGSSLQEVIAVVGEPSKTVNNDTNWGKEHGVLYTDIRGRQGNDYWSIPTEHIRIFFQDQKVVALYLVNPNSMYYQKDR